ncbi:MAG: delta-aminolevulinic acid dehydratase, partial [Thermoplasmata archaeon]|nr:delta-aminolevulinic acid dehydratase [Thermoplasmata archaeon]
MTAKKEKRRAEQSLELLLRHVEAQGFTGYDPMDALNSPHIGGLKAKWPRLAATLFFRYSPLDLRKAFGVEKEPNPKAMGIFLSSYSRLHRAGYTGQDTMKKLYRWLLEHRSQGYDSSCWGYNYPWQD